MIKPFTAYAMYMALKLHFEGKYDAIKYQFKTSASEKSFWKRKDKFFFAKIANKFQDPSDLVNFYVSQFVHGKAWIGDIINRDDVYQDWLKTMESLSYRFEQDLYKLEDKVDCFDELFEVKEGQFPVLISSYLEEEIMLETVVILDVITNAVPRIDKQLTDTIIWPELKTKIRQYAPFVPADDNKLKKVILKVFTS